MKIFVYLIYLPILLTANISLAETSNDLKPLNIILMIGDGMGPGHIKAYRKFMDDPKTAKEEKIAFDHYLLGSISTESSDLIENITDSSAAATAYATGQKCANEVVALDEHKCPIGTVLEKAKRLGLSTGMVVTSQLVDATPAAFLSHNISRRNYDEIADEFFDNQYNTMPMADILFGGGTRYFKRSDRDLITEFSNKGYAVVTNKVELQNSNQQKTLGLFAEVGLDKMWDREATVPSLADMTNAALKQLSKNKKGFFLLVEASKIDWASHENDIVGVISEMQDFEKAFEAVIAFAKKDLNTLVIVTADHETGGLSVGSYASGEKHYYWDLDVIKSFKYTTAKIATAAQLSKDLVAEVNKASSLVLSEKEKKSLEEADLSDWYVTRRAVSKIINARSFTGWTTFAHTGVDVNLYAYGPGSERLKGHMDNTFIGQYIFELLESNQ